MAGDFAAGTSRLWYEIATSTLLSLLPTFVRLFWAITMPIFVCLIMWAFDIDLFKSTSKNLKRLADRGSVGEIVPVGARETERAEPTCWHVVGARCQVTFEDNLNMRGTLR
jgi:hypothetical protein